MKRNSAAVFRHIADTLFVIVVASSIVLAAWKCGRGYHERATSWVGQVQPLAAAVGVIGLSLLTGWSLPQKVIVSVRALRLFPRHWGLIVRTNLGCLITVLFACWSGLLEVETGQLAVVGVSGIVLEGVVVVIAFATAKLHVCLCARMVRNESMEGIEDGPIHCLKENLFAEYEITARRIVSRLELGRGKGTRGPNLALIGPYGSGKTSICNLVEDICRGEQHETVFCRFEAWQFLTADAAVRGLLDQIVNKVQELVDCSRLGSLPEEYLDALRACPNGWAGMIGAMLSKRRNPEEIIQSVQDVLLRIRRRLVVFVDDFDRLESKSTETQEAIAAALNQLQNLTTVQYVLCVGRMREGAGGDLLKLTRFQELMPEVAGDKVIGGIRDLRDEAVRSEQVMYYPWDLKKEGNDDPLQYYLHREEIHTTLVSQLVNLIETPRQLKAVEREMREKWNGGLKGEISWYDLLLMSALKVGEPGVFEWVMREEEVFLDEEIRIKDPSEEEKREAKGAIEKRLNELIGIKTKPRLELVQQVLVGLFPNFMKGLEDLGEWMTRGEPQAWEQRIALKPGYGTSYFRRYMSGCVPSTEVPDQGILEHIRDIQKRGFDHKDFEQRYLDSYEKLTNDLNKFRQFSGLVSKDHARDICDCILEWMCDREHWSVWDEPHRYVSAVMSDVKSIIESAGQVEFSLARRKDRRSSGGAADSKEWCKERLEALLSKDVIVAQSFGHYVAEYVLGTIEVKNLVGAGCTRESLNNPEGFWKQAKGHCYYLSWLLDGLKFNDDYVSIRDQVTESILERAGADQSGDIIEGVVISLVHFQFPASGPDLIDEYEFSVNKEENREKYNMDMVLPVLKCWKGRSFHDQVASKGYEHLLTQYAEEIAGLQ